MFCPGEGERDNNNNIIRLIANTKRKGDTRNKLHVLNITYIVDYFHECLHAVNELAIPKPTQVYEYNIKHVCTCTMSCVDMTTGSVPHSDSQQRRRLIHHNYQILYSVCVFVCVCVCE